MKPHSTQKSPVFTRRRHLAALSGLMFVPLLSACGWSRDLPIAVAAHVWVGYEPMFMARDRGWLDAAQVVLHETHTAVESVAALRASKVQAAALTLDEVLAARASGLDLAVVLVFNVSMGADMLLARPDIHQLAQLKGERIGYEASSVAEVMLAEILKRAGLVRQDVRLVKIAIDEHMTAWQQHGVEALITYEPVATQLMDQGMVRLFDSQQIPDTIVDVLAVRRDVLDGAHAKALKHLVAGHFRALDHLTRNPQDASYRMAPHLNLPPKEVLSAFKGLIQPTPTHNHRLLAGDKPQLQPIAQRIAGILRNAGLITPQADGLDIINGAYLPSQGTP